MAKKQKSKPKLAKKKPKPVKRVKALVKVVPPKVISPIDELIAALRVMVISTEAAGNRDKPEVVLGREMLTKHEKPA